MNNQQPLSPQHPIITYKYNSIPYTVNYKRPKFIDIEIKEIHIKSNIIEIKLLISALNNPTVIQIS